MANLESSFLYYSKKIQSLNKLAMYFCGTFVMWRAIVGWCGHIFHNFFFSYFTINSKHILHSFVFSLLLTHQSCKTVKNKPDLQATLFSRELFAYHIIIVYYYIKYCTQLHNPT